jgi:hypothetical protein
MIQVYFLSVAYLLVGAGLLLVDQYGGRLLLLIRLMKLVPQQQDISRDHDLRWPCACHPAVGFSHSPRSESARRLGSGHEHYGVVGWFVSQSISLSRSRKAESVAEDDEQSAKNREGRHA